MAGDDKDKTHTQMKEDAGKAHSFGNKLSEKFKNASRDMQAKFNAASRNMDPTFKNSATQKSVVTNDSTVMSRDQANQQYADAVRDSANWQKVEMKPAKKLEMPNTNHPPVYYNGENVQTIEPTKGPEKVVTGVTPEYASENGGSKRDQANQQYADAVRDSANWQKVEMQPAKKLEMPNTNHPPVYYNGENVQTIEPTKGPEKVSTGVTPQVASPQKVNTAALLKAKQNAGR